MDSRPTIDARSLVAVLKILPPEKSVLIVGPHGVGKSHIAKQIAEFHGLPLIDRRLSQMTEGDMIGIPVVTGKSTKFLAVDWFIQACDAPAQVLLDEFNRASTEIMNAGFQVVLDRELNGNALHPESRVIACINAGSFYSINEMDPALVNRFAVFHLDPTVEDFLEWAATAGIDPVLVDFIRHHPTELRFKDLDKMESLTAYPTPRGWESVDKCLKAAKMAPADVAGMKTPDTFFLLVASIVGHPTAIAFTKFVSQYSRVVTAEDIFDRYDEAKDRIKALGHDGIVALLDKVGQHCVQNDWTKDQVLNLEKFGKDCLTGEDHILLWSRITTTKRMDNIKAYHATGLTKILLEVVETAEKLTKE